MTRIFKATTFHNSGRRRLTLALGIGVMLCFNGLPQAARPKPSMPPPLVTAVQSGTDVMARANALYAKGEFGKALLLYRKANERGADPTTVAFNSGNCLFRLNRFAEAAAAFRKAYRLSDGKYLPAQFNLAAVLFRLEDYGECIAVYRRALKQDPENASAWMYLADAYTRTHDFVGALQALEKARDLEPEDVSIVYQMAETHASLKEYGKAIELVREAYARLPAEVDFLFYIGDLQRAAGDLDQAAAAYREGLAIKDKDTDVLYKLADVLAQSQKPFLAMEWLEKAVALKPDFADAWIFIGNLAFDAKWWDRCQNAYLQATQRGNAEGLEGLRNLAYEFHQRGQNDRAAAILLSAKPYRKQDRELAKEIEQYQALDAEQHKPTPEKTN